MPVTPPRNSSRLRRWTLKLTLALLAGAVVTWGVAWGFALWTHPEFMWDESPRPWPIEVPAEYGATTESRTIVTPHLSGGEWTQEWSHDGYTVHGVGLYLIDYGWPCRSLRDRTYYHALDNVELLEWTTTVPEPTGLFGKSPRRGLPYLVLPLGFTLNSLLAAAVLLTITEGAGAWRRRARRRKGKCPWCGYDRAGVAVGAACPECGREA